MGGSLKICIYVYIYIHDRLILHVGKKANILNYVSGMGRLSLLHLAPIIMDI